MSFFSRFKKSAREDEPQPEDIDEPTADDTAASDADEAAEDSLGKEAPRDRAENGPFDSAEEPSEADRLDLGALKIPVFDQMQVQLEQTPDTGDVVAATLVHKGGNLQLQAFAAPTTEGLWAEVREQTAQNIAAVGGRTVERYTDLGTELHAHMPVQLDGEDAPQLRPVHFIGIDGPRWFLRAALTHAAVEDGPAREELRSVIRGTVVDRGTEAKPPREVLVLTAPNAAPAEPEADDDDPLNPGPTIAEVR